jgi:hypothetical protein
MKTKTTFLPEDIEKKTNLILRILSGHSEPTGARQIANQLHDYGVSLSERSVRYHLQFMDERGLTELVGKTEGRLITKLGTEELVHARVRDKIGFVISKIEVLAFKTTLDPYTLRGNVPVNISLFPEIRIKEVLDSMKPAFEAGLCVSNLIGLAGRGELLGDVLVPQGKIGIATVCSIVINGFLLKNGIPMDSKFGGILQIKQGIPLRFVELVYYSGSSLDPSEMFIRGKMTSVMKAAGGEGNILANFREIPAPSFGLVKKLLADLQKAHIHGVQSISDMGEAVCQTPVDSNKVGMILTGGLNPIAYAQEMGIEAENHAMSTVMDYQKLAPFSEVRAGMKV